MLLALTKVVSYVALTVKASITKSKMITFVMFNALTSTTQQCIKRHLYQSRKLSSKHKKEKVKHHNRSKKNKKKHHN